MKNKKQKSDGTQDTAKDGFGWLNPKCEPLTTERLGEFPGMENLSAQEAEQIVYSISLLAALIAEYTAMQNKKANTSLDPGQVNNNHFNKAA